MKIGAAILLHQVGQTMCALGRTHNGMRPPCRVSDLYRADDACCLPRHAQKTIFNICTVLCNLGGCQMGVKSVAM